MRPTSYPDAAGAAGAGGVLVSSPAHADGRDADSATAIERVGVAFPGDPGQPATWSGTPSGVIRGLSEAGIEAVAINVEPGPRLRSATLNALALPYLRPRRDVVAAVRHARAAARACPALGVVYSAAAKGALRQAGELDGIIQIGTGYKLPAGVPIATFEDMTVAQTKQHPYPGWELLSPRAVEARVAAQRRAYAEAVACCLTSRWAAESVIRDYGVPASKVHVVGVGRNHTAPVANRDWRQPRFLFVGMEWARKNGDGVVRAFVRLRGELPLARLDVVGQHPRLDEPGVVGHGVLRLDVPEERDRVERLFSEATCFVMPSHVEASAIAYVEAAAAGLPSIGTSCGGSEYLIGDGGLIVDPSDDQALLAAMRRLSEPETAARMGAAARRRSEMFTWPAVARRLVRALTRIPKLGSFRGDCGG
jgi:glycosyltransferase involved in cell wall biosynthesis